MIGESNDAELSRLNDESNDDANAAQEPAVEPKNALRSETRIELHSTIAINVLYYSTYCLLNF